MSFWGNSIWDHENNYVCDYTQLGAGGHGRLVWSEREAGHGMTLPVPQGRGADPFKGQHMSEGWAPRTGRVRK